MIKNFFHNVLAELGAIFGDRGVLLIMGFAVIFYAFVYPLPYSREVLRKVPLVVIDHDNSALSRQLVRMVDASDLIRVDGRAQNLEDARKNIAAGRYSAALVIPVDFEKTVLQARRATVAAYVDATYFLVYRQAMTGLVKAVRTLSAGIQVRRFQAQGWSEEKARVDRSPLNFIDRPLFNPSLGYATYIVPGVLILILQQTMLIGIGMISGRKNTHRLIHAYAKSKSIKNVDLVLIGGLGYQHEKTISAIEKHRLHDKVKLLGYVPDKDIPLLYSGALGFVFPTIYVGFGLPILEAMASRLVRENARVEVAGHTSNTGSESYNLNLSQERAESVMAYLKSMGVPAGNMTAKGYGMSEPVADNATQDGRNANKRVELRYLK